MKLYKLIVHTKNFSVEDLIINPKDFPSLKKGDIVEIYHPEDDFSRLLLQITSFKDDLQGKETISVEQSIANTFQLRTYADVYMNVVNPDSVALDSVELTFKDQYLGRSEMWRLKNSLTNTCVYLNKKIEFLGGSVRCQVYEMWAIGDRVACGVITDNTKVVFRSSTSMVYLFLQMSSEMWDFDIHGDLYFEKAVNCFMADLFQKWKKHGSNHEVTIVLFSRTFYQCSSLDEFPDTGRECLQQDYKGRFYEDFYRVAIQNERYDDWSHILVQLRRLFTEYQRTVLEYHSQFHADWPKPVNSTAAQGNFLEVLNMSLNVFEKHYLERSFDRTGQLAVVITPGVGVFEVDRELTNVTKQRIIDNGVGCDVVCVGEQPLHAVPLLKFQNKDVANFADDYSMPHWINLSFYSTNKKVAYSTFIPRIKLPPRRPKPYNNAIPNCGRTKTLYEDEESIIFHSVTDYDAYDAQVFTLPSIHTASLNRLSRLTKKASVSLLEGTGSKIPKRKMSDPDIHHPVDGATSPTSITGTSAISIPTRSEDDSVLQTNASIILHSSILGTESVRNRAPDGIFDGDNINLSRVVVGSMGSPNNQTQAVNTGSGPSVPLRPGRALINPFDPSHVTIKLTSNRRRWSHIFPKGPTGLLIQQHHYQAGPPSDQTVKNGSAAPSSPPSNDNSISATKIVRSSSQAPLQDHVRMRSRPSVLTLCGSLTSHQQINRKSTLLWGATGEQEWTPALTTGVDWKSLTIPACLPITTDYFPDEVCLKTDYVFSDYSLLPDGVNADFAQQRAVYRKPLSTQEVFCELVSQRLSQGFQLIVENVISQTPGVMVPGSAVVGPRLQVIQPNLEYKLSIGRVFHRIVLNGSEIGVTRYRPKYPYPPFNIHYHYRFHAPDHDTYEVSWVSFNTEKLENYNWNYLDHYICTRGDTDFALAETLKYWRFRVYLLPLCSVATRRILEGSEHCDLYTALTFEEQNHLAENFLRYIETWVNKIRRPNAYKKYRLELASLNVASQLTRRRHSTGIMFSSNTQTNVVGNSPFRERLGSNRLPDKPRPRSGSKVMERGRASPATDVVGPLAGAVDNEHTDVVDDNLPQGESLVLKDSASHQEIIEAMRHPLHGIGFFSPQTSLPSNAFVSSDAVSWLRNHMDSVTTQEQAVQILENLRKEQLICHASGEFSYPIIVGFYLYHIVAQEKDKEKDFQLPFGDLKNFEDEWLEVEVKPSQPVPPVASFLSETLPPLSPDWTGPMYKHTHLEIDVQGKSDRVEWGHARYQSVYQPDRAFEMAVQWMAASGTIVSELITGWARKAQTSGLLMIPIPPDPFALPYSIKSDPLRGPVFIPLDFECLMGTKSYLFEEFREETWAKRLMLFQEAVAIRFGFIACSLEAGNLHLHYQYIHLSGNVFLMIPSVPCEDSVPRARTASVSRSRTTRRYPTYSEVDGNPHQQYITQHVNVQKEGSETRVGFLWSWNHMVSRRWKWCAAPAKSDEAFQNKLLSDFRHFCANRDNRLKAFWDSSWTTLR